MRYTTLNLKRRSRGLAKGRIALASLFPSFLFLTRSGRCGVRVTLSPLQYCNPLFLILQPIGRFPDLSPGKLTS